MRSLKLKGEAGQAILINPCARGRYLADSSLNNRASAMSCAQLTGFKFEKEVKKDERLTWWEFASRFFDVLDQEENKKIAARGLKPMSDAERKKRNIEAVYLDDAGQVAVKRFSDPVPNNSISISIKGR